MKIIVGISNVNSEEVISKYAEAGVDEFFIGFVSDSWVQNFGWEVSCNRRAYSNCNYKSIEEIENLVELVHRHGKKVFLTLNAHEYNSNQIKLVLRMLDDIKHIPVDAFIVGNLPLMLEIRKAGYTTPINLSIGAGGNSFEAISFYTDHISNIGRIVLPRKLTVEEIGQIAEKANTKGLKLEAFGLADACFFNDEYCFSWHGASNKSFCESPMYKHRFIKPRLFDIDWKTSIFQKHVGEYYNKSVDITQKIANLKLKLSPEQGIPETRQNEISKHFLLGTIGKCGLCALQKFKDLGVDAVKIPLRGHLSIQTNLEIINMVKTIIDEQDASPNFCRKLLDAPNFCSGKNCFYNYPYSN